jgi:hypothetical protein
MAKGIPQPQIEGRNLLLWLVVPLVACIATWPTVLSWGSTWAADPDGEVGNHVWGLHTAWVLGRPLGGWTTLMNYPEGLGWVLVDPASLPLYGLGEALGGPVLGFNLLVLWGALLMALAGWLLARSAGVSRSGAWVGAWVAGLCPQFVATVPDGQTESFGVGWVGLQLAFFLSFLRLLEQSDTISGHGLRFRRILWGALAAGALAVAWYNGAYNGLFASMFDLLAGGGWLVSRFWRRENRSPGPLVGMAGVALLAGLLVAPLGAAVLTGRAEGLPGSASRATSLVEKAEDSTEFRGGLRYGADLFDLALPEALTGSSHRARQSHSGYLGLSVILLAGLGLVRQPRRLAPWGLGAAGMALLALGPWLSVWGRARWAGGAVLVAPAGILAMALPLLERITRWYRAAAPATLLLAPMVAVALELPASSAVLSRARALRLGAAALVAVDCLLLAPLRWPLPAVSLPQHGAFGGIRAEGAIFVLPSSTFGEPPHDGYRDVDPLLQVLHGRSVSGGLMGHEGWAPASPLLRGTVHLLRSGEVEAGVVPELRALGFRYLAIHPSYRDFGSWSRVTQRCFGGPVGRDATTVLVDLAAFHSDCIAGLHEGR